MNIFLLLVREQNVERSGEEARSCWMRGSNPIRELMNSNQWIKKKKNASKWNWNAQTVHSVGYEIEIGLMSRKSSSARNIWFFTFLC